MPIGFGSPPKFRAAGCGRRPLREERSVSKTAIALRMRVATANRLAS